MIIDEVKKSFENHEGDELVIEPDTGYCIEAIKDQIDAVGCE